MTRPAIYLGDGLYAEHQGHQVRLYASNGITATDQVFLDREMLTKLMEYMTP